MTKPFMPGGGSRESPLEGYKILVVDDEDDVRLYISTLLEDAGARICEATDGHEAVAVAKQEKPDLITLDLSMPGRDGVEAFCDLRKTPETANIAVCIVTGHPEFRKVIYDRPVAPPEGYMDKPIDDKELVATIRRILGLRKRRAWRSVRFTSYDI
jgi:CheY-like chemotaxis protein